MTKEIKQFFKDGNYLNKGFANQNDIYIQKVMEEFADVMPSPEILHAYEDIRPGTLEQILSLMEKEQKHKHIMEGMKMAMQSRADFMGKLFAALIVAIIGYVTIYLSNESLVYAVLFSSVAFFSIFSISLLSYWKNNSRNHQRFRPRTNGPNTPQENDSSETNGSKPHWQNNRDKGNYRKPIYKKKAR
jgi:hypothetical protein